MTRVLPRTNFHSPRLVRSLRGLSVADVAEPGQSVAERLSQWLGVTDAIALFAALNPGPGRPAEARCGEPSAEAPALREELARLQAALGNSIGADDISGLGSKARIQLTQPTPDAPLGIAVDFLPYRRYYLSHQRAMAAGIALLRAKARQALASGPPRLARLAELDAALDQALTGREHDLLATVPALLEKRFEHLSGEHRQALMATRQTDDPDAWMQPGGWLARFCGDLQDVLLAELELRLLPVAGLIEAYGNEVTKQQ